MRGRNQLFRIGPLLIFEARAERIRRLCKYAGIGGEMTIARRWVDKSPADSAIAHWVNAKLLLRAGKLAAQMPEEDAGKGHIV